MPGYVDRDNTYVDSESNTAFWLSQDDNTYVDSESNAAFWLSHDNPSSPNAIKDTIINICAFMANAMVKSIQFDACEEFNGMVSGAAILKRGPIKAWEY